MRIHRTGNAWLSLYDYNGFLLIKTRDWKAVHQICAEYLERTGEEDNGVLEMLENKMRTFSAAVPYKDESKVKIKVKPLPEPEPELDPKPKKKKKEKTSIEKMWD